MDAAIRDAHDRENKIDAVKKAVKRAEALSGGAKVILLQEKSLEKIVAALAGSSRPELVMVPAGACAADYIGAIQVFGQGITTLGGEITKFAAEGLCRRSEKDAVLVVTAVKGMMKTAKGENPFDFCQTAAIIHAFPNLLVDERKISASETVTDPERQEMQRNGSLNFNWTHDGQEHTTSLGVQWQGEGMLGMPKYICGKIICSRG